MKPQKLAINVFTVKSISAKIQEITYERFLTTFLEDYSLADLLILKNNLLPSFKGAFSINKQDQLMPIDEGKARVCANGLCYSFTLFLSHLESKNWMQIPKLQTLLLESYKNMKLLRDSSLESDYLNTTTTTTDQDSPVCELILINLSQKTNQNKIETLWRLAVQQILDCDINASQKKEEQKKKLTVVRPSCAVTSLELFRYTMSDLQLILAALLNDKDTRHKLTLTQISYLSKKISDLQIKFQSQVIDNKINFQTRIKFEK